MEMLMYELPNLLPMHVPGRPDSARQARWAFLAKSMRGMPAMSQPTRSKLRLEVSLRQHTKRMLKRALYIADAIHDLEAAGQPWSSKQFSLRVHKEYAARAQISCRGTGHLGPRPKLRSTARLPV